VTWPDAEVELDEALVRQLLREQHADLAGRPLRYVDAGFDNTLWRLGDDLLVKLPRRLIAANLTEKEQRWLPQLAPGLPLAIPAPVHTGRPSDRYPWPWSIVPWLEGEPGDRAAVTKPRDAGGRLGRFLRTLHQEAPTSAPFNPWRSVALRERTGTFEDRLAMLQGHLDAQGLRRIWKAALAADPHRDPAVWIHGDLHPANVLLSEGTVVAVLDFGDLCAGDPATDLGGALLLLPANAVEALKVEYGGVDDHLSRRSLAWGALFGLMLLELAQHGRPSYEGMARAGLERVLAYGG
jgi:aminoglycoside phosphotransferase (APT) family kinase protein